MDREELRKHANQLKPRFIIGKNGLTKQVTRNISDVLKKENILKIRFLKTAIEGNDKRELIRQLLDVTGTQLVELVGFTATITKNKLKKEKVL